MISFTINKDKIDNAKIDLMMWYRELLESKRTSDGRLPRTKMSLHIIEGPYETFKYLRWNVHYTKSGDLTCSFDPRREETGWNDIQNMLDAIRKHMVEYKEQQ